MYEVKYSYGYNMSLVSNTISENLFAQVDAEGNWHVLFDVITDHHYDDKKVKQQDYFTKNSRCV